MGGERFGMQNFLKLMLKIAFTFNWKKYYFKERMILYSEDLIFRNKMENREGGKKRQREREYSYNLEGRISIEMTRNSQEIKQKFPKLTL